MSSEQIRLQVSLGTACNLALAKVVMLCRWGGSTGLAVSTMSIVLPCLVVT